ncbi:MAG: hypothetical protein ACLQA5_05670 [Solirubrobacteraceae bacterium]
MAPAGALTAVQLSATVPAPAAAVTVVAGSAPTVADAVADAGAPVKYACALPGMTPASNSQTQAAMSRLRRWPPAGNLVERFACTRGVRPGGPGSPPPPSVTSGSAENVWD